MRLVFTLLIALCTLSASAQDFSCLETHPRLFLNEEDFAKARESENPIVQKLNSIILQQAEDIVDTDVKVLYKFDESGRRLLQQSRSALRILSYCSYAYRFTGKADFLNKAEQTLNSIADFPSWNADRHFLDAAEMSLAVAIAYDWLFEDLSDSTKLHAYTSLNKYAFQPSADEFFNAFYYSEGNWNQVCNAGLVAAAIATYEKADTTAQRIISDAIRTNKRVLPAIYSPDGSYPEGPSYWSYGNMFQAILNTELEKCFDTDFGLSEVEGFNLTPEYLRATRRPGAHVFNYSDNIDELKPAYPLWYFASKFKDISLLDRELEMLGNADLFLSADESRLLPLLIAYALNLPERNDTTDKMTMYVSKGKTPIFVTMDNDLYLGVKGGSPSDGHAHMDGGSFVFDVHGNSWAVDLSREAYAEYEKRLDDFWNQAQNSPRWQLLRYNNLGHNTITVNDSDFNVKGRAELLSVIDGREGRGCVMDLSSLVAGEAAKVVRKIVVRKDGSLLIEDTVVALEYKNADIRWNLVTPAKVSIVPKGLILKQNSESMSLRTRSKHKLQYCLFSSDPEDYDFPLSANEAKNPGVSFCGYTARVEKGKTAVFTTVLRSF